MSKCCKFCPGIEIKADFHSKMSVCRQERGVNPLPDNYNPDFCHSDLNVLGNKRISEAILGFEKYMT